jgi:hypothetical protein
MPGAKSLSHTYSLHSPWCPLPLPLTDPADVQAGLPLSCALLIARLASNSNRNSNELSFCSCALLVLAINYQAPAYPVALERIPDQDLSGFQDNKPC